MHFACQVVSVDGKPSMLLTSATVHSGASGGALVSLHEGVPWLVGMVTSNAR